MRYKYRKLKENEWVNPVRMGYRTACCDCGLVHELDFRLVGPVTRRTIQFRVRRNNRATGQIRRHSRKIERIDP